MKVELMNEQEVAELFDKSTRTVRNYREKGLRFAKIGRSVFYRPEWIADFIENHSISKTDDAVKDMLRDLKGETEETQND